VAQPLPFRPQALEFHRQGGARGDVLHLTPRSFFFAHWSLVAAVAALCGFAWVGEIDEYASGPALVQVESATDITAQRSAVVAEVEVEPGQHVAAGQALLRMQASAEQAELDTVERELSDQLAKLLRDPADRAAREAIVSLRSREALARGNLERQTVRATRAATVGDVRVQRGQLVDPGAPLLNLLGDDEGTSVTALLPGRYRPLLARGMKLRFVADGFPRAVHALVIERVADQIVGPSEALRFLGRDAAGALALNGPVVLVHARLPSREFVSQGARYRFHHGMQGQAETAVRRDSIAFTFVPGLRALVGHDY
jgi:membrane fusion protein (multidrug efflux system)